MRRTLEFLKWRSTNWLAKASSSALIKLTPSPLIREGLTAYAFRQAEVFLSLHDHFLSLWSGYTALHGSAGQLPPIPTRIEDAMQGVDGGDI